MTPDLAHITAFVLGSAAGMALHAYRTRAERRHAERAVQMAFEAGAVPAVRQADLDAMQARTRLSINLARVPLSPPDPVRSAAGRKGAAVTNTRRATEARRHRKRVLEVAEQMRQEIEAKRKQA